MCIDTANNEFDYKTHKSYKLDSELENAALQYSALPTELQRWSFDLQKTAEMNI